MSTTVASKDKVYRIATIPGDGIGIEITEAAVQVLKKLAEVSGKFQFEFEEFDWSSKRYKEKGHYIPPDGIDQLKKFNAVYFGAVGWPGMDISPKLQRSLIQLLRAELKLHTDVVDRCTGSHLPLGPDASSPQLPNSIRQRPTNTHPPRHKVTARKLPSRRLGLGDHP